MVRIVGVKEARLRIGLDAGAADVELWAEDARGDEIVGFAVRVPAIPRPVAAGEQQRQQQPASLAHDIPPAPFAHSPAHDGTLS